MTEIEKQLTACLTLDGSKAGDTILEMKTDYRMLRAVFVCGAGEKQHLCTRSRMTSDGCGYKLENNECANQGDLC
jgi:hypothetical protein